MAPARPQFVADDKGRKKAVILSIKGYQELVERLEDLEDALELDEAARDTESMRDYRDIRKELKEEGLM